MIQNPVAIILLPATSTPNGGFFNSDGLKFPAAQVASADANTLDDYEEGSYTPTINIASGYNHQTGRYEKIGSYVHISGDIEISGSIGGATVAVISGAFPFTHKTSPQEYLAIAMAPNIGSNPLIAVTQNGMFGSDFDQNGTITICGVLTNYTGAQFQAGTGISFNFGYRASA